MRWCIVFIIGLQFLHEGLAAKRIPPYITICKRKDPDLNKCFKKAFEEVMSHLNKGVPEMNIRKIDPLHIDELHLAYGNGTSVSFNAKLSDMEFIGFLRGKIETVNIDVENMVFNMSMSFPTLSMESNYNANGKVLLLQFDSAGPFTGNFTDIFVDGTWTGYKYMKKGREHGKFNDSFVEMKIKHIQMYFDNLFPTQPDITIATNRAIEENIDVLYDELKPVIIETVKTVVLDSINNVYDLFPMDMLFPN